MLKTPGEGPHSGGERSFGELASQLVDDAKAYAQAEVDLAKAIAADKVRSLRTSAILLALALFVAIGAFSALGVAIFVGLATLMSPVLAGIVAFVMIGGGAGLIGWFGIMKLRDAL